MNWKIIGCIACKLLRRGRNQTHGASRELTLNEMLFKFMVLKETNDLPVGVSRGISRSSIGNLVRFSGSFASRLRTRRRTCLNMFVSLTPSSWYMRGFQSATSMQNRKTPRVPRKASTTATVLPDIKRPLIIVAWSFIFHFRTRFVRASITSRFTMFSASETW